MHRRVNFPQPSNSNKTADTEAYAHGVLLREEAARRALSFALKLMFTQATVTGVSAYTLTCCTR
jgi:hypothetical protein